jgi:RNA polymerase sigma-70 factor, ECF subfamily
VSDLGGPDDEQLAALYVRARRTAGRIVGHVEAEDVASETVVRLTASWPRVGAYAPRWVIVVAGNLAVDRLRRRPRPVIPPTSVSFEDEVVARLAVRGLLGRLPARQRQAMTLRYLVQLSEAEVAETLDVSLETVRTHLSRGRAAMRHHDDIEELRS